MPIVAGQLGGATGDVPQSTDWDDPIPVDLRVEYTHDPFGIDNPDPFLSWRIHSQERGTTQTAYRILVASSPDELTNGTGDVWDSGLVESKSMNARYGGPSLDSRERYYWSVQIVDQTGDASDWSEPAWWEMGLLDEDDWEAEWIRKPRDDDDLFEFNFFRTEFELEETSIDRVRAYVSAYHQYELRLNGEAVDMGPSFNYPDRQYYKVVDVTDQLVAGENAIGVLHNWSGGGQGRPHGEPGLIVQLEIEYEDGTTERVTTDDTWRVRAGPWQTTGDDLIRAGSSQDPVEVIDGRDLPRGYAESGFDDDNWDDPEILGTHPTEPWERLISQEREVTGELIEEPETLTRLDNGDYVADFGKVYSAIPRIRFEDGEEGRHVEMVAGYRLTDDGQVDTERGVQSTDMRYEYTQRDGEQVFRPFLYLGYRYFQIEDPGEELEKDQVQAFARWNDVPDTHAATFESSNEMLNDVWELSRRSLQYASQEQFVDTPTREKGQFLGDAYNISWATMQTFEERKLSRQALREFFDSQERFWSDGRLNAVYPTGDGARDIPDYSQKFVDWVWRYYHITGDEELLKESYPVIRNVAEYVDDHVNENGLVVDLSGGEGFPYEYGIVDWPDEMRYDYDRETGAMTTVNVYGVAVFRRVAQVAEILGRSDDVDEMRAKEGALTEAINEHLVRDGGLYVDGLHYDGSQSDRVSQHANAFALAWDIVPAENVETVADHVVDRGVEMGPATIQWLLYALLADDRYDALVDVLTDPSHDGWARILDEGGTFLWESWHGLEADEWNRSLSHAWAAVSNVMMQEGLLGVTIEAPGATALSITPPPAGLDSASGIVPTEHGDVCVSWERTETPGEGRSDNGIELSTSIPANTPATVRIPTHGSDSVRVCENGKTIWNKGNRTRPERPGIENINRTDEHIVVEVTSGEYVFELEQLGN
ncbi:family 78 glycoside hydrolase catalytic domain [Halalkalicoccus tibetensis]|uniref:alpha-L-rhamnosidase n=2 Tax=Halalkalicoccus tibetensis TaxID=175632 RepID=A0ABD5V644_9EURY